MAVKRGVFSTPTIGNVSISSVGFQPTELEFFVSGPGSSGSAKVQYSSGGYAQNQTALSIYQDSTGSKSQAYTNRCINHFDRVSGTITEVVVATFVSFDASGFTLNFSAANVNYGIHFIARG